MNELAGLLSLPSHGLLDCCKSKSYTKNIIYGKFKMAILKFFFLTLLLCYILNSNPIIQQSINPLIRHPVG
jgi:hypothetical protein